VKQLNVGLIGAGFMGKAHALAYAAMPMYFWPAPALPVRKTIVDINEEIAAEAALRYGFEKGSGDWRTVIADDSIDVVDIATPNHMHAEIVIAAAKAGKHIICEKPLARDGAEAKLMYEAVKVSGVVNMVSFNYRRTPAVALAKKLIDQGDIGEILSFRGVYLQDWSADPDSPLSWRFQRKIAGSGSLGDIGTHVIDLALYLCGEITQVNSQLRTWIKSRPIQSGTVDKLGTGTRDPNAPRAEVDVDDEVLSLLEFKNGAIGSIESTRNAHGRNNYLSFEIHGTKGSIIFNYERRDELQVAFASDPSDRKGFRTIYTGPAHPYGDALWPIPGLGIGYGETKIIETHDFFDAIVNGKSVSPSIKDGYQINLITDAITQSAVERNWIPVQIIE
jgi:predicted dehydrogenase